MIKKNKYTYEDLISCGEGNLFGNGNARLPSPPMLMFDKITEINDDGGNYKSILEFEIVSPRRIAAAASKLLKYHSVSTESQ